MKLVSSPARRGFTLIELLVVIAIIGILSAVVLASLNTARNKGADAAIKSNIDNARAAAELFYDTNGSYGGVCSSASGILPMKTGATNAGGTTVFCNDNGSSTPSAWAMSAGLKATAGTYYCVDSTGKVGSSTLGNATTYACP